MLKYPFQYDNYHEILIMEFGRPFSKIEAYDESVVRKYYDQVGHLGTRIYTKCEICNQKFTYIYKGGPKRHSCPECVDWSKKFPLESSSTYWIVNSENS